MAGRAKRAYRAAKKGAGKARRAHSKARRVKRKLTKPAKTFKFHV